jgi:hypothetical protein
MNLTPNQTHILCDWADTLTALRLLGLASSCFPMRDGRSHFGRRRIA